jgi:hypothetical protein
VTHGEGILMNVINRLRFFSFSLIAFLIIVNSTLLSLSIMKPEDTIPEKITALTGRQSSQTAPIEQVSTRAYNLADQISDHISELHFIPLIIHSNRQPPTQYLLGADIELLSLVEQVRNEQVGEVRGIYVSGVFALPVVQQPSGDVAFVSDQKDTLTQFSSAARAGVTGILAHNYLSGDLFYDISIEDIVYVIYGDGSIRRYQVELIEQYQRLQRSDLRSNFLGLASEKTLTSDEVFDRYYRGPDRLTFQTCLERFGTSNWGLTFTTAFPLDTYPLIPTP